MHQRLLQAVQTSTCPLSGLFLMLKPVRRSVRGRPYRRSLTRCAH